MSKILYFDCFSGASGDMVLGALLDAGLPLAELDSALGSLMIPGYRLAADRVLRAGVSATKFRLIEPEGRRHPGDHEPGHPHTHHGHRSLAEIVALIERSSLSADPRARAIALFRRLAEAEAEIHQMPVEQVHLHEVGALDSIIDIVGAVFGLQWFGADRIVSSPLNVGGGMVQSAHGLFPVPAPATLRLLEGVPVYSSGVQMETVTPTGALLVAGHASAFGPMPAMRLDRVGYGAGDRDLPGTPNVLRILVGDDDAAADAQRVVVLECEIDDMNPQIYGVLMERLYAAGALEVFYTAGADEEEPSRHAADGRGAAGQARRADRNRLSRNDDDWATLSGTAARLSRARDRRRGDAGRAGALQDRAARRRGAQRVAGVRRLRARRRPACAARQAGAGSRGAGVLAIAA